MPPSTTLSPAAIRTRRYRNRRDRGSVIISLEVENYQLEALINHGFLDEGNVTNRAKVSEAVDGLLHVLADGVIEIDWEKYDAKYG